MGYFILQKKKKKNRNNELKNLLKFKNGQPQPKIYCLS